MPVPTLITDLSTTAGSNYPLGTDSPSSLDDVQRAHASFIAGLRDSTNIHAATSKTTPVDADEIHILDSASTYLTAKLTWANLKATAKTYFDTLYLAVGSLVSPGPIGSTTPSTGAFTTLSATAGITETSGTGGIVSVNSGGSARMIGVATGAFFGSTSAVDTVIQRNSSEIGRFSSTGLAVTGALSATGALTTAGLKEDTSGNLGLGVVPSAFSLKAVQSQYGIFAGTDQFNAVSNAFYSAGWKYVNSAVATQYGQAAGSHLWYTAPSGTAGNPITFTQALAINASGSLQLFSATTAAAPAYVKGAMYFDTTLNKLRIGGATAWETVTSV